MEIVGSEVVETRSHEASASLVVHKFINDIAIINSRVDLVFEDNIYDAKSILMILSINLCEKLKLVLHSDNEDEIRKFNEIAEEYK